MTYDDWKLRSDRDEHPEPEPNRCASCGHPEDYCDCPCCNEWDDEKCHSCNRRYPEVWWAGPALFGEVTGRTDGGGLRCISCFDAEARKQGIYLRWTPKRHRPDAYAPPATEAQFAETLREIREELDGQPQCSRCGLEDGNHYSTCPESPDAAPALKK